MLVILEGVDGSGKTTLLNKLLERGYMCKKLLRENNESDEDYVSHFAKYDNAILVVDRSFITDAIYRCIQGGRRESVNMQDAADILSNNVKIIHCTTLTSFDDGMKRGEDNITDESVHLKLKFAYKIAMEYIKKYTKAKVMSYDWHYQSVDDVIKFIQGGNNNDTVSV